MPARRDTRQGKPNGALFTEDDFAGAPDSVVERAHELVVAAYARLVGSECRHGLDFYLRFRRPLKEKYRCRQ